MPGTCEGQDLNSLKTLSLAVESEKRKTGRGRLPRKECDERYCFIEATGGKRCRPNVCRFSGEEHPKRPCPKRAKAELRMKKALGKLAEALDAANADGVLTPDEKARIRELRAWLKTLGE